jgi:hypothetical protein
MIVKCIFKGCSCIDHITSCCVQYTLRICDKRDTQKKLSVVYKHADIITFLSQFKCSSFHAAYNHKRSILYTLWTRHEISNMKFLFDRDWNMREK